MARLFSVLLATATITSAEIHNDISGLPGLMCGCETETSVASKIDCLVKGMVGDCKEFSVVENVTYTGAESVCINGNRVMLPWQSLLQFPVAMVYLVSEEWSVAGFSGSMTDTCALQKVRYSKTGPSTTCQLGDDAKEVELDGITLAPVLKGILATVDESVDIALPSPSYLEFTFGDSCTVGTKIEEFYLSSNYKWPKDGVSSSIVAGGILAATLIATL